MFGNREICFTPAFGGRCKATLFAGKVTLFAAQGDGFARKVTVFAPKATVSGI